MKDYSIELHKQARTVEHAWRLFVANSRKLGMRDNEAQLLAQNLQSAADSLALAAGSREASRIIAEFRPS